jgi:hypothetical protein
MSTALGLGGAMLRKCPLRDGAALALRDHLVKLRGRSLSGSAIAEN